MILLVFILLVEVELGHDDEHEDPSVLEYGEENHEDTGDREDIKIVEACCHIGTILGTVEGINSNQEEDNEATKPTRDNVRSNKEADPGANYKEIKRDVDMIEKSDNLSFKFHFKPAVGKLYFWIRKRLDNRLVSRKICKLNPILQLSLLNFTVES